MKHEHVNYLTVGTFVLIILASLIFVLAWVTKSSGPMHEYHAFYSNVAGLKYGTLVTYEGFHIGQVEEITPVHDGEKTRYRVDMHIRSDWKIPSDSVASIVSSGLLAQVNIDIQEGTSKKHIKPGNEIMGREGANMFAAIASAAAEISDLTSKGIAPLINTVSKSVTHIATQAETDVPMILEDMRKFTDSINKSAATLESLLNVDNRNRILGFIDEMEKTLGKLDAVLDTSKDLLVDNKTDIEQSIIDLRETLRVVAEHIHSISFNMETTSRNMSEFSRQIRENPGVLLGGKPQKEVNPEGSPAQ